MADTSNEETKILEARKKMIERRFGGERGSDIVGGCARRKKKVAHKTTSADDKKLMMTLRKLGIQNIPACEEVNMFKDNGEVIHFVHPKVQASVGSNTYVVTGSAETKKLQDMLPGIINELGAENMASLRAMASGANLNSTNDDDDDVPDLVDNFEAVAQ